MKCPKCPGELLPFTYRGIEFNCCSFCYGIWFDKGELAKFNRFDSDFPLKDGDTLPGKSAKVYCPRCPWDSSIPFFRRKPSLKQIWYAPGVDLELDYCVNCGGIWLDEDEIAKVQKVLKREDKLQRKGLIAKVQKVLKREGKLRRKGLVELKKVAERERALEARIAQREVEDTVSWGEWFFLFLTKLPREVYHPVHRFPKVTVALIVTNMLVFLLVNMAWDGSNTQAFFLTYGFVPDKFRQLQHLWGVLTSLFLHGGPAHLLGNMYFLYTFGDNVEEYLGSLRFSIFYFLCGVIAVMFHFAANIHSTTPLVGASGAISGILGAYMLLFSHRKLYVLIFYRSIKLRALWYLGLWIAFQVLAASVTLQGGAGVAHLAHIGGFLAGVVSIAGYRLWRRTKVAAHPA